MMAQARRGGPGSSGAVAEAPDPALARLVEKVARCGLFDLSHYRTQRRRCPADMGKAIADYLTTGWLDGLDPGPGFSTRYYLAINDDVRAEGCNPLLHYIDFGRSEGRLPAPRTLRSGAVAVPPPTAPTEEEWDALQGSQGVERAAPVVDVVVPVYGGHAETLRCLHRVLSAPQRTPYRLVVIDDCSPDAALGAALERLAERGFVELHRTPENLGFLGACNLGMALHAERDVVLLNSDTQVFGDWLDRLRASVVGWVDVATATPFSNNAEICSYPAFCRDNWSKLGTDDAELDRLAATVNQGATFDIPTGVGFCMYIRRACLDQIGVFDQASFGRGYGEENDLCRRAVHAGWRNVLAADVFVRHYGGVSFGETKAPRLKAALETLQKLHPDYRSVVSAFIAADPVRPLREALDVARLRSRAGRGAILFVSHTWGGGTERHMRELSAALEVDGAPVFFCREVEGDARLIQVEDPASPDTVNLPAFDLTRDVREFSTFLRRIGVRHVHIHNLAAMDPVAADFIRVAARLADLAYDVTLHDYQAICPRLDLVDRSGVYCGEPPVSVCEVCVGRDGSPVGRPLVWMWRDRWGLLLAGARRVFVPDRDVALRMHRHFPDVRYTIRPHSYVPGAHPPKRLSRAGGGVRRIAVLGAIGPNKGSAVLRETARAARARDLPLAFIVVGYTDRDAELKRIGNVTITGRYPEAEAVMRLRAAKADLAWFPAVWPETFSYTLSIALEARLFPVAFNLGAPARRLSELGWGAVWPMQSMLDPTGLATLLLEQPITPPPADLADGLGSGGYVAPLRSYYELEDDDRLARSPQTSESRPEDRA